MMRGWRTLVVALAGVGFGMVEEAAAGVTTSPVLQLACAERLGSENAVFACDPQGGGRRISLRLGEEQVSLYTDDASIVATHSELGDGASRSIGRDEPLHAGETVVLDWPAPSARAELAIKAFTPYGVRTVVLRLSWRPEHVEVTVRSDGSLEVVSPERTEVVAAPTAPRPESSFWQVRSAREAADRVLWVVDHLADRGQSDAVMHTLCAGLHPDIYAFYGIARQLRGVDIPDDLRWSCTEEMSGRAYDLEGVFELRSSRHVGRSLRVSGRRAVLRTTIVNRFRLNEGFVRAVIHARVLLIKDRQGIWRLASFNAVLPALNQPAIPREEDEYAGRSLDRWYQYQRREAAGFQAAYDREQADRRAARVAAGTQPPCTVGWRVDPEKDVEVEISDRVTRRPLEHLDVDLVAAGFGGRCLGVRTSGALPTRFKIWLSVGDQAYHVLVDRGHRTVLATRGTFEDHVVPGIEASISDHELIVRFARAIPVNPGSAALGIAASPMGIRYSDGLD